MNAKALAVFLVIICLGLGGVLYYRHTQAVQEKKQDVAVIEKFSNDWSQVSQRYEEQKLVNLSLERDLETRTQELKAFSNNLASTTANLSRTQNESKAAAEAARAEMLKRDAKIAELESERDGLTKKMADLTSSIGSLEAKISDTQKKLDASEGDREFLLKELKRLQTEKAELERQFNDLALLREQVRHIRDEMSITRRLEWIRRGLYGSFMKGGERLQKGFQAAAPQTNYNLNVELNRDGTVKIIPPVTNAPPANVPGTTNPPPANK